jgi:hypothetical protein
MKQVIERTLKEKAAVENALAVYTKHEDIFDKCFPEDRIYITSRGIIVQIVADPRASTTALAVELGLLFTRVQEEQHTYSWFTTLDETSVVIDRVETIFPVDATGTLAPL